MARANRYQAKGRVYIAEITNTEALLKNFSSTGLCIQTPGFMELVPKTRFSLNIVPEDESNIDQFSVEVESRWVKAKMTSSESGFAIVFPPGSSGREILKQYLQFLASQSEKKTDGKTDGKGKIEQKKAKKATLDISNKIV